MHKDTKNFKHEILILKYQWISHSIIMFMCEKLSCCILINKINCESMMKYERLRENNIQVKEKQPPGKVVITFENNLPCFSSC